MSKRTLLRKPLAGFGRAAQLPMLFTPFYVTGTRPSAENAVTANRIPKLAVACCLLGMHGDMHTASLFPLHGLEAAMAEDAP